MRRRSMRSAIDDVTHTTSTATTNGMTVVSMGSRHAGGSNSIGGNDVHDATSMVCSAAAATAFVTRASRVAQCVARTANESMRVR